VCRVLEAKLRTVDKLPKFSSSVPFVVAGGTSLPIGYIEKLQLSLSGKALPFEIGDVRRAENPLTSVANGCLIAAQLEE
jgi:hypothetical protein